MKPPSGLENGGKTSGIRCKETVLEQYHSRSLFCVCRMKGAKAGMRCVRSFFILATTAAKFGNFLYDETEGGEEVCVLQILPEV